MQSEVGDFECWLILVCILSLLFAVSNCSFSNRRCLLFNLTIYDLLCFTSFICIYMRNRCTVTQNSHLFSACRWLSHDEVNSNEKETNWAKREMQNEKNKHWKSLLHFWLRIRFLFFLFVFSWIFFFALKISIGRFYFSLFLFYSCFNRRCDPNVCVGFFFGMLFTLFPTDIY